MSGQWADSTRREQLPPNWWEIRAGILDRDGHQCTAIRTDTDTRCRAEATDVDHVDDRHDHRPENLASLCSWHHDRKSSAEGNAARWAKPRPPTQRFPTEVHPGLS